MTRTLILMLAALAFPAAAPAHAAPPPGPDDERARRILSEMVRAYRSLRSFEQETTYGDAGYPSANGMVRLHVLMRKPNRLLLQVWRGSSAAPRPQETRFVCDGKQAWAWSETPGYYTQEKAPKSLSGFRDRVVSIDLAMLFGLDPFAELLKRTRAVRLEGTANIDGVDADIVLLDIGSDERTGEIRLSIGQKDHLLRRFTYDSRAAARPAGAEPTGVGPAEPQVPQRFGYTNHVVADPDIPEASFRWIPPAGAFKYTPYPSLGNLGDLRSVPGAEGADLPNKQQKLIPLQEYIRRSKKLGGRR